MNKKIQNAAFKLIDVIMILTMVLGMPGTVYAAPQAQDSTPVLRTSESDYAPGESAHVTGSGFAPGDYDLVANGEEWGTVPANEGGEISSDLSAPAAEGSYEVRAFASPWSGDWDDEAVVASTNFTVTAPPDPTATPTEEPTPTEPPTAEPTQEPTATEPLTEEPTQEPTATSTTEPTATESPTEEPTQEPTATATTEPTATEPPTAEPTQEPTATTEPTQAPTDTATNEHTQE